MQPAQRPLSTGHLLATARGLLSLTLELWGGQARFCLVSQAWGPVSGRPFQGVFPGATPIPGYPPRAAPDSASVSLLRSVPPPCGSHTSFLAGLLDEVSNAIKHPVTSGPPLPAALTQAWPMDAAAAVTPHQRSAPPFLRAGKTLVCAEAKGLQGAALLVLTSRWGSGAESPLLTLLSVLPARDHRIPRSRSAWRCRPQGQARTGIAAVPGRCCCSGRRSPTGS